MDTTSFALRHIGPSSKEQKAMLNIIGVTSIEQLVSETIPANIRLNKDLDLASAMSEQEYLNHIYGLSQLNDVYKSYIGLGYHPSNLPAVIQRNILENPGWYTAYTPYQAEIAQGRLEALLNFQTMVIDLTGMEMANASLLDESTAAAEAMSLLFAVRERDQKKSGVNKFFVSDTVFLGHNIAFDMKMLKVKEKTTGIKFLNPVIDTLLMSAASKKTYYARLKY